MLPVALLHKYIQDESGEVTTVGMILSHSILVEYNLSRSHIASNIAGLGVTWLDFKKVKVQGLKGMLS